MGFLDTLLGRSKPVRPNLDILFAVPSATLTLQASGGFAPTGAGSVCFKNPEGMAADEAEKELRALLSLNPDSSTQIGMDEFGFTWVTCRRSDGDVSALVTDLHAINTTLDDAGFGPSLLCTMTAYHDEAGRRLGLVYLYKRGTFYPFAPTQSRQRDTELELRMRGLLDKELPVEKDLGRWFPVWDAPGL
jgi:hypothetical protein